MRPTFFVVRIPLNENLPSKAGATFADVELFAKHVAPHVKIKAAGGISSLEDAEKFIELGASRLGTSRVVKIAKGLANDGSY